MIRAALAALILCHAQPAAADPVAAAEAAAGRLLEAGEALARAETARDRVAALTGTIRAYEAGLAALRQGMRDAALRERELKDELGNAEARYSSLLGALMTMEATQEPMTLFHPGGAVDSARAGMILAEIRPAIEARTARLRARLEELEVLQTVQDNAAITLERSLADVQTARRALSRAIAERTTPPDTSATDIATMQALVNSADTLDGFASTLATLTIGDVRNEGGFSARKGSLPLPVPATRLTGFEEPDAKGRARPGLTLAVPPQALVTAPHAATLRYAGPLLDLGEVAILEPEPGYLLILAGLAETFGTPGDILAEGAPLGLMGGEMPDADQILIETSAGRGQDRGETLYMELRLGQSPVDPAEWFIGMQSTGR